VQCNTSFNQSSGTTRGIHAEPWDKLVFVTQGRVFAAWVDLREGENFGRSTWLEIDEHVAVLVPKGVGNSYQTLCDDVSYTYLVGKEWQPNSEYTFVNLRDESLGIPWPQIISTELISDKDASHPYLRQIKPVPFGPIVVLGAKGQVAKALKKVYPEASFIGSDTLDLATASIDDLAGAIGTKWLDTSLCINAAAFTAVDAAQDPTNSAFVWNLNAELVSLATELCKRSGAILAHISSDYVFDGKKARPYDELSTVAPQNVYGFSKAAGDLVAGTYPRHFILRTSWVIGDGKNFVTTMWARAQARQASSVVDDQIGRPTFADTIASAVKHLVLSNAPYGTYNVQNSGPEVSWFDLARFVYKKAGADKDLVSAQSTEHYIERHPLTAKRPAHSALDTRKIEATGFFPQDYLTCLDDYLNELETNKS
jgi:dTDP-4-dehydrorhamnose 3,5-epimerase